MLDLVRKYKKKKNFYQNISFYFIFSNYKFLLFFKRNNSSFSTISRLLKYDRSFYFFNFVRWNYFSICANKFLNFLKGDLYLLYFNNIMILDKICKTNFINDLILFSIDFFFINYKNIINIDRLYFFFNNNFYNLQIFLFKIYYLLVSYTKSIINISNNL